MKLFLIYTIIIAALVYIYSSRASLYTKFMSKEQTGILKGFAILTVLWAHSGMNYGVHGIQWIAGIGVALFLVFSGYGLSESFKKNGLKDFWKKRFVGVVIPFYIVYFIGTLVMNHSINLHQAVNILLMQDVNWYIQYIIISYVIYWFVTMISEKFNFTNSQKFIFLVVCFIIWFFIDTFYFAMPDDPFLRARQMLSFPFGVLVSNHLETVNDFFRNQKNIKYFMLIAFVGIFSLGITQFSFFKNNSYLLLNSLSLLTILPLTIFVIWLSTNFKVLFNSKFLLFTGSISYELYLVQAFSRKVIIQDSFMTLLFFLIITFAISYILKQLFNKFISKQLLLKLKNIS